MRQSIQLAGGNQQARSVQINAQRTINWYPVVNTANAKGPMALYPTPGLRLSATTPDAGRSNGVEFQDKLYFVCGSSMISVDSSGIVTTVGTVDPGENRHNLAAGRDYVMTVDGFKGWTWDGTTFAEITDADFPDNPTHCAYLDGFFIVNDNGTDQINISAAEDPTAWNALDFATAEADPDDVLAVQTTRKDLYLIGSVTTEIYYNSGNVDFPFEVYPNGVIDYGVVAKNSVASAGGVIFMLARRGRSGGVVVVQIVGFEFSPITDNDMAYTFRGLSKLDDAYGMAYTMADETFYVLTFPTASRTFVYHSNTGVWHERASPGCTRWCVSGHGHMGNIHYCVDRQVPNLYTMDPEYYEEAGEAVTRRRISYIFHADKRSIEMDAFELEFEAGTAPLAGQGSDPKAMLKYSVDGGKTWSYELLRDIGARGEYSSRVVYHKLGMGKDFVFDVKVSDPLKLVLQNAYIDYQVTND